MQAEGAVEMVRRGYEERTRCLDFTVGFFDDMEGAQEAVRVIGHYNEFNPTKVNAALDNITQYMHRWSRMRVGREDSPVLYFEIAAEQDYEAVKAILTAAGADEINLKYKTVRAWWD